MNSSELNEKTISLNDALCGFYGQLDIHPDGKAWGIVSPDYVRQEIEKLADNARRISLKRLSGVLLRMHTGRLPGNVNTALHGVIDHAYRRH
jgi:hypothetical protein